MLISEVVYCYITVYSNARWGSLMKILMSAVCLAIFLTGCGSGSASTASNTMMQGGQWEFAVVPENGSMPMFIEVNLPGTNGTLTGTHAQLFQPSEIGLPSQSGPIYCGEFNLNGKISNSTVSGNMSWSQPASHFANFSGELASDGQSLSKGAYKGGMCLITTGSGAVGPEVNGTFTGYTISPVNSTFTGTLNSSLHGPTVVTLAISQNSDFSLNATGTSVGNGVTTQLSSAPQNSSILGATVYISGGANNVNGSESFSFAGHLNPAGTQLTIALMNFGGNEDLTGTLTRQ